MNTKDFLALITKEMLEANPMGFPSPLPIPPATKRCSSNWRVVQGSCWQKSMHYRTRADHGAAAALATLPGAEFVA